MPDVANGATAKHLLHDFDIKYDGTTMITVQVDILIGSECLDDRLLKLAYTSPFDLTEIKVHKDLLPWILIPEMTSLVSKDSSYTSGLCEEPNLVLETYDSSNFFVQTILPDATTG